MCDSLLRNGHSVIVSVLSSHPGCLEEARGEAHAVKIQERKQVFQL